MQLPYGRSVRLRCTVRSGTAAVRRVEFHSDQWPEVAAIAATLFEVRLHEDTTPATVDVPRQRRWSEAASTASQQR